MIHEAYMPIYRCPDFHCAGAGPPEVVQEALADLKSRAKKDKTVPLRGRCSSI